MISFFNDNIVISKNKHCLCSSLIFLKDICKKNNEFNNNIFRRSIIMIKIASVCKI